jgi:hypothetical protein
LQGTYTVTMPAQFGGFVGPNQILNYSTVKSPVPSPTPPSTGGEYWLDGCAINTAEYTPGAMQDITYEPVPSVGQGSNSSFTVVDTPFTGLDNTLQSVSETDAFVTTFMFKPSTGPNGTISDSIWVPLNSFAWSYSGTAVNNNGSWTWASSPTPNPTQEPAAGTYDSTSVPMPAIFTDPATFPTWSGVNAAPTPCPTMP